MPASERSLRLTNAYRAQLVALTAQVTLILEASWRQQIRWDDLDASFPAWLATAVSTVTGAQSLAVSMSGAYVASYVAAELDAQPRAAGVKAGPFVGTTQDGRSLAAAIAPALISVKVAIRDGADQAAAERSGLARGTRLASNATLWSSRVSLDEGMRAEPLVVGWRRVTRPMACGAFLAAATGAIQHESETLACHDHCHCTKEPVVRDAPDRFERPTGREMFDAKSPAEQDAMFAVAGGSEAVDLIRSGAVPFDALILRTSLEHFPDQITQQSLGGLLAHRA